MTSLRARELAESPRRPWVFGAGGTASDLGRGGRALADRIGYPVLIKAAHGGGGRGMKLVESRRRLADAWAVGGRRGSRPPSATAPSSSRRYVRDAKHVEVQVLGDGHG